MKNKFINKIASAIAIASFFTLVSCENYLNKAPEVNITDKDVFSEYKTFQGYLDDAYQCIVDVTINPMYAEMNWDYGDECVTTHVNMLNRRFDEGDYWWAIQHLQTSPFYRTTALQGTSNYYLHPRAYWQNGWMGIRKANSSLQHLGDLKSATQEQRDLLEGQALFFRGYLHFEILRAWGGIPYVEQVYQPSDVIRQPRLTYRETADKISADLRKAVDLLPADWDETAVGQATTGLNFGRITKLAAYGMLGKNLLYAGSPLMNGVATGNYVYDEALCREAADAFAQVIKLADGGYAELMDWDNYFRNFYNMEAQPATSKEVIFSNPIYNIYKRWLYSDFNFTQLGGWGTYSAPTENYVEFFGMDNGLDIKQADAGYNPADPWKNRDPRFYYNIIVDGDRMIQNHSNEDTFAKLFMGGRHRSQGNSLTGYGYKKYKHLTCNSFDDGWHNVYGYEVPKMRLADIYLMYAEAVNEAYGPMGAAPGGITAVDAVNKVRNRANLPGVDARYTGSKEVFREFVRKERAVELAFEAHRWYDLRRWYVAHLPQYREKYTLEFDQEHTYFKKVLYTTRVFEPKHYWLPFPIDQVSLYPEFGGQNPGW